MRVRFKPTIAPVDCVPLDSDEGPVLLKLTTKGQMELYNWAEEADLVFMGFGDEPPCFKIIKIWDNLIIDSIERPSALPKYAKWIPLAIRKELKRTGPRIKKAMKDAFNRTTYRQPSSRYVDTAGLFFRFEIMGVDPTGEEYIGAHQATAWHSKTGKIKYPGQSLTIILHTSVGAYITLLNKIPDGVIYDPKTETWCLVAAIVKVINKNTAIVASAKQGRGLAVIPQNARVEKDSDGDWVVKKWL